MSEVPKVKGRRRRRRVGDDNTASRQICQDTDIIPRRVRTYPVHTRTRYPYYEYPYAAAEAVLFNT